MRKIALSVLSVALVLSLFPVVGLAVNVDGKDALAVSDIMIEEAVPKGTAEASPDADVPDADGPNATELKGPKPEGEMPEGDEPETGGSEKSGAEAEKEAAVDENVVVPAKEEADGEPQAHAAVQNIPYVDASGNALTCAEATEVTADDTEWASGWYVATGSIALSNRVDVKGAVNLILADGCILNATKGIGVYNDNAITIWAQAGHSGTLNATGSGAGIGGDGAYESRVNAGTITINGGIIYAKGASGCAGIGGGSWSNAYGATSGNAGTITINGGTVTAEGSNSYMRAKPAAAIGGAGDSSGGAITITGGTVNATGYGVAAAAIGGGSGGRVSTIFITGGTVVAEGGASASSGNRGPGIGNSLFQSTLDGPAYVETNSSLGNFKSGILNQNGSVTVRGDQKLPQDLTIEVGKSLVVTAGGTLTIPTGTTVTNNGSISNDGTLLNNGSIANNGTLINSSSGAISGSGSFSGNRGTQAAPAAPMTESVEAESVTLVPTKTTGQGASEYACVEGDGTPSNWQTATAFTGLKDNTTYTFYARYAGDAYCEPAQSTGTTVTTKEFAPGAIENVTVAADNYLGADFAMPADYFAENVLPDSALQQNARGKDIDIWMESVRVDDSHVTSLVTFRRGEFLPLTYFSLTPYYQIDGKAPERLSAETRDDALVQVKLTLLDSAVNTDPTVTREYKVICVYNNTNPEFPCSFNPDTKELTFRTNRFASFGLVCKDMRDGKQVFPVMVRDSYASASGQGQYAEGDKVTIYAGEREDYAVEFWNAATAQGSVNFTYEDADRAEFTMPAKPVVVSITWKKLGDIRDVTDVAGNALHAQLVDTGRTLAGKVLSEDAMSLVMGGMNADIWLKSVDGISDSDAAAVANALDGWTLAEEVDLTLFYEVDGRQMQVHESASPVGVRLTLPDSAINADTSKTRAYEVIRVHDGATEVIPCTFDATAKTLTFESDRFSAYAVAYKDAESPKPPSGDDSQGGDSQGGGSQSGGSQGGGSQGDGSQGEDSGSGSQGGGSQGEGSGNDSQGSGSGEAAGDDSATRTNGANTQDGDAHASSLAQTGDAWTSIATLLALIAVAAIITGAFSRTRASMAIRGRHARK